MKLTRRGPLNWSPITGREKKCVGHPSPAKERRRIVGRKGRCIARVGRKGRCIARVGRKGRCIARVGRKGRCIARVGIALVQNPAIFCCQCTAVMQGIYNVCRL